MSFQDSHLPRKNPLINHLIKNSIFLGLVALKKIWVKEN